MVILNSISKTPCHDNDYPKFLIISSATHELAKLSPFYVQKALLGISGNPKSVKKLRSNDLLVETSTPVQSKSLLSAKLLGNVPITVTPHNTLNSSRGVISEIDLINVPESEITEELQIQGVINCKRITIRKGQEIIPTKHVILTFNQPEIPKDIKAGYLNCPVRPYIPNPLRCFQCQRFGHSKNSCRGRLTCSLCSLPDHSFETCTSAPKCINCLGPHSSNSKSCPSWQKEREIQKIKVLNKVSYPEARRIVLANQPPNLSVPYSTVLKQNVPAATKETSSISTQTEPENIIPVSKSPIEQPSPEISTPNPFTSKAQKFESEILASLTQSSSSHNKHTTVSKNLQNKKSKQAPSSFKNKTSSSNVPPLTATNKSECRKITSEENKSKSSIACPVQTPSSPNIRKKKKSKIDYHGDTNSIHTEKLSNQISYNSPNIPQSPPTPDLEQIDSDEDCLLYDPEELVIMETEEPRLLTPTKFKKVRNKKK